MLELKMVVIIMLIRVELLPGFKFTGKMVKIMEFTGKIGKASKR